MPTTKKITKKGTMYEVVEQFEKSEQTSLVDKEALTQAIKELKVVLSEKTSLLDYKEKLLKEIKAI